MPSREPSAKLGITMIRLAGGDGHLAVGGDPIAPVAALARAKGWPYRELYAPHDPQLFDPDDTAAVLHELAAAVSGTTT